jgi:hypothetical protein
MGLDKLFAVTVREAIPTPPRTTCAKCGEALGFVYREHTHRAVEAYCPPCQWLLRDVKISVFLEATRPSEAVVSALGLPANWDDRQNAEPIPMAVLSVEEWPEIDVVPRAFSMGVDFGNGLSFSVTCDHWQN